MIQENVNVVYFAYRDIFHVITNRYRRLDSGRDAVWKTIYPDRTDRDCFQSTGRKYFWHFLLQTAQLPCLSLQIAKFAHLASPVNHHHIARWGSRNLAPYGYPFRTALSRN